MSDLEQRVAETIRSRKMILPGDRVAVALSGGKDSTALLMILCRLLPAWDDVRLTALTIDEGILGYREDTIRSAERLVGKYGLDHIRISFADLFGGSLDEILKDRRIRGVQCLWYPAEEGAHRRSPESGGNQTGDRS